MRVVTLDPVGLETTRLGFGCAGLMRTPSRRARQRLLAAVLDQGVRHFDTARMYGLGAAEGELGRALRGRRDDVVIATKFGIDVPRGSGLAARLQAPARKLLAAAPALRQRVKRRAGGVYEGRHYDVATARASLETSLRELGTDYVDLFLVHGPLRQGEVPYDELGAFLRDARDRGLIRAWGVSGGLQVAAQVRDGLPEPALLQVHDTLFTRAPAPPPVAPAVTYGALAGPLERLRGHVGADPERRATWSEAVGADAGAPAVLGSLLLRDAMAVNPDGTLLFSTTRPERVAENVQLAASALPATEDEQLTAFRALVATDLEALVF